jgi:heat-inducible transcriptional repressor
VHERRILLVAVFEGGQVRQQLLELSAPISAEHLRMLSSRLTEALADADAERVRDVAANETGAAADVTRALARLLDEHDAWHARDVYVDGFQNILAKPEFSQTLRGREMLKLFEDHTRLAEILPLELGAGDVHVSIGSEHRLEPLRDCSFIVGRYGTDAVGFVGVLGPTRMDYARSIGAVRYVGSLMSDLVRVMEGR